MDLISGLLELGRTLRQALENAAHTGAPIAQIEPEDVSECEKFLLIFLLCVMNSGSVLQQRRRLSGKPAERVGLNYDLGEQLSSATLFRPPSI